MTYLVRCSQVGQGSRSARQALRTYHGVVWGLFLLPPDGLVRADLGM
jgi:hypothetical protein